MEQKVSREYAILGIERQLEIFLKSYAVNQGLLTPSAVKDVSSAYKNDIDSLRNGCDISLVKYFGQGAMIE